MTKKQNKVVSNFMGLKDCSKKINDWNFVMSMVDKIETIIEHAISIDNCIEIVWWYSPKKTGTFSKGAGGGGGHTEQRTPFESIFGKHHDIYCYYQKDREFKVKENEHADTKIAAVCIACFRWIEWYDKTVLKNKL